MMATQQYQLALANPPRASALASAKAAFPQKLYEILNQPGMEELIRWTDDGESFYVVDHERLAREVLGRWFKHDNFNSFVRQLNMYGFRKIAQMQQGVLLPSQAEREVHFEHPYFKRGRQDQLVHIKRKKGGDKVAPSPNANTAQSAVPAESSSSPPPIPAPAPPGFTYVDNAQPRAGPSQLALEAPADGPDESSDPIPDLAPFGSTNGEVLDVRQLATGLATVKHTQAVIVSEIDALKKSTNDLWQQALVSQQESEKQGNMLNQIVKFLQATYGGNNARRRSGNGSEPAREIHTRSPTPVSSVPRKRPRLLIGDGSEGTLEQNQTPSYEMDAALQELLSGGHMQPVSPAIERFATVETPASGRSPEYFDGAPGSSQASTPRASTSSSVPSSRAASSSVIRYDSQAALNTALQGIMSNPEQYQQVLHAIATQNPNTFSFPPTSAPSQPNTSLDAANQQLLSRFDFSQFAAPSQSTTQPPAPQSDNMQMVTPYMLQRDNVERTSAAAAQVSTEVDDLQTSLDGIMASLGMDPSSIDTSNPTATLNQLNSDAAERSHISDGSMDWANENGVAPDFDFDAFLRSVPLISTTQGLDAAPSATNANADTGPPLGGAFLDEIGSQASGSDAGTSPAVSTVDLPTAKHNSTSLPQPMEGMEGSPAPALLTRGRRKTSTNSAATRTSRRKK